MKVSEILNLAYQDIHKDEAKLVLATLLNKNPLELILDLDYRVPDDIKTKYLECVKNIKNGIPIQYALNSTNFFGFDFYVDKRVLIPRFETEELVYNTNIYLQKYFQNPSILDLGCGSGCIGLTLKKLDETRKITLLDVSLDAIAVAKENSKNLGVDVNFLQSDVFSQVKDKYDVIISNPPYISYQDDVSKIVLDNEPTLALYAKDDGLEYYDKILSNCKNYLNDKFLIAFEIGASQKDKVVALINKYLTDVRIICKKDMSERDRMIFIFKNININE